MSGLARRSFSGLWFLAVVLVVLLFGTAGSFSYWQGWLYWAVFIGSALAITLYLLRNDSRLLESRLAAGPTAEKQANQKVIQAFASLSFISLMVLPGLDHRFSRSNVPHPVVFAGDFLVAAGFLVVFLVFRENSYTSGVIEVAGDQRVISTGPYRFVRHPMYAGALVLLAATPPALGSWWALLAVIPMIATISWRLLDEERFLTLKLPGYSDYCSKVKHHLVPGGW